MKVESVGSPELFERIVEEICPIYYQSYGIFSEADSVQIALLVEPGLLFFNRPQQSFSLREIQGLDLRHRQCLLPGLGCFHFHPVHLCVDLPTLLKVIDLLLPLVPVFEKFYMLSLCTSRLH